MEEDKTSGTAMLKCLLIHGPMINSVILMTSAYSIKKTMNNIQLLPYRIAESHAPYFRLPQNVKSYNFDHNL